MLLKEKPRENSPVSPSDPKTRYPRRSCWSLVWIVPHLPAFEKTDVMTEVSSGSDGNPTGVWRQRGWRRKPRGWRGRWRSWKPLWRDSGERLKTETTQWGGERCRSVLWPRHFSSGTFSNEYTCAWKNNGKPLRTSSTWQSLHYRQIRDLEAMHEELSHVKSELSQTRGELVHSSAQKEKISSQVMSFSQKAGPFGAQLGFTSSFFLNVCQLVAIHESIHSLVSERLFHF